MTHLDDQGRPRLVDVSAKPETYRRALAEGYLEISDDAARVVAQGMGKKGNVLTVAEIAAIAAAKRTPELIPLCHPLRLARIDVSADLVDTRIRLRAEVSGSERTGFEMDK